MEVTTAIHLDTRRQKKDGTYPVRIRVSFNRVRKYYSITNHKDTSANRYCLVSGDYDDMMEKSVKGNLKKLKDELQEAERKARIIINSMDTFSFGHFEQLFNERRVDRQTARSVKHYFETYISELKEDGQIGTAMIYDNAKKSLFKYWSESVSFDEITVSVLKNYKNKMLEGDPLRKISARSPTTVSIYTRCFRKLYNSAILDGVVNQKLYPFGKIKDRKFEIPKHNNIKKALSKEDIKKIFEYKPKTQTEAFYRDIWVYLYISYGMNISDLCDLKYSEMNEKKFYFYRNKTENKSPIQIQVLLTNLHIDIIERYGTRDEFIFPVLCEDLNQEDKRKTIKQFTKMVNKYMKKIAEKIDIDKNISTQYARHSFATIARNGKIPDGIISQLMGHMSNSGVTSNYFGNEVSDHILEDVNRVLVDW